MPGYNGGAGGRPTKYRPEFCEKLIGHMAQGLSFETFAADLDCCSGVLYEWVKRHPEFSEAKKIGLIKCQQFYERAGIAGMAGKIPGFNAAVWIFNLKNRFGWTDRQETNTIHTVKPLVIEKLTGEQLMITSEKIESTEDEDRTEGDS